jgi:hypothetical protein
VNHLAPLADGSAPHKGALHELEDNVACTVHCQWRAWRDALIAAFLVLCNLASEQRDAVWVRDASEVSCLQRGDKARKAGVQCACHSGCVTSHATAQLYNNAGTNSCQCFTSHCMLLWTICPAERATQFAPAQPHLHQLLPAAQHPLHLASLHRPLHRCHCLPGRQS